MADDDTQTTTPAAPTAPASPDMIAQAMQLSQQLMPQPVQQDTTPLAQGGIVGLLGNLGMAIAGRVRHRRDVARSGRNAPDCGRWGISARRLMAGSGYYPGKPSFGGLAQGFHGAETSERGSEQQVASQLGAQQDYQTKQAALGRLKALQDALPLLTLDFSRADRPPQLDALAGSGAAPGAAAGAGQPGATYESTIGVHSKAPARTPVHRRPGTGQFLDSTWQDFASANPDLFKGEQGHRPR